MATRIELERLMSQLEEMWGHLDTLFRIVEEAGMWDHRHGAEWTFADVPFHLAYCNRELVIRPIRMGRELPEAEMQVFATVGDIDDWNNRRFAARPDDQTGPEAAEQMRSSWDEMRELAAGMSDADLEAPYWSPFLGGNWLKVRDGLGWTLSHDWSEFMQLRIHMGQHEPVPTPGITSHYLARMIGGIFPFYLDREAAEGRSFTAVMAFSDPLVGAFTIKVKDGQAVVQPGAADDPDLILTQSAETFEKTLRGIQAMPEAMAAGEVHVSDPKALATFGKLFPMG